MNMLDAQQFLNYRYDDETAPIIPTVDVAKQLPG